MLYIQHKHLTPHEIIKNWHPCIKTFIVLAVLQLVQTWNFNRFFHSFACFVSSYDFSVHLCHITHFCYCTPLEAMLFSLQFYLFTHHCFLSVLYFYCFYCVFSGLQPRIISIINTMSQFGHNAFPPLLRLSLSLLSVCLYLSICLSPPRCAIHSLPVYVDLSDRWPGTHTHVMLVSGTHLWVCHVSPMAHHGPSWVANPPT